MTKTKRTIRKSWNASQFTMTKEKMIMIFLGISTLLFISVQLYTNALLSPLGHKLASLNNEKNLLLEENRDLKQDIAKNSSITIISKYADKKLNLTKTDNSKTIYPSYASIQASR